MSIQPVVASTPTPDPQPGAPPSSVAARAAPPPPMKPDRVEKSDPSSDPDAMYRALQQHVQALGSGATAALPRIDSAFGAGAGAVEQTMAKAASAVGEAATKAAPIASRAAGAAGFVLATTAPAGNAGESAPNALWRETSRAASDRQPLARAATQSSALHGSAASSSPTVSHPQQGSTTVTPIQQRSRSNTLTPIDEHQGSTTTKPIEHAGPSTTVSPVESRNRTSLVSGKPIGLTVTAADQATIAARQNQGARALDHAADIYAAHLTPTGTLANADKATGVDEKLSQYSLNDQHQTGAHKARVFKSALGYDHGNAQDLSAQIKEGIKREPAIPGAVDEHGVRFTVDVPVTGPAGSATVRTGWIYQTGADAPRMTTGFVK